MVEYRWVSFPSVITSITNPDMLFHGDYTLDPYQKCDMGCIYCDSSEGIVYIKSNVVEILSNEIDRVGNGTIIVGSVSDPYQRIESKEKLTQSIIKKLIDNNISFHMLTKSDLVLRDIDYMKEYKKVRITISISTMDNKISKIIEPNAPTPDKRLEVVKRLSETGIKTGVAIMPILPFITDKDVDRIVSKAKDNRASYIIYEYLELRGDNKDRFISFIDGHFPDVGRAYRELYRDGYKPKGYSIDENIRNLCKRYRIDCISEEGQ